MITSFIIHYSGDEASLWEDGDAIEFQDIGEDVSTIFTRSSNLGFADRREDSTIAQRHHARRSIADAGGVLDYWSTGD
jgi:hypothetical protein